MFETVCWHNPGSDTENFGKDFMDEEFPLPTWFFRFIDEIETYGQNCTSSAN